MGYCEKSRRLDVDMYTDQIGSCSVGHHRAQSISERIDMRQIQSCVKDVATLV